MAYEIQVADGYGNWDSNIGDVNNFETEEEAADMIEQLKALDENWAAAHYRIMEID